MTDCSQQPAVRQFDAIDAVAAETYEKHVIGSVTSGQPAGRKLMPVGRLPLPLPMPMPEIDQTPQLRASKVAYRCRLEKGTCLKIRFQPQNHWVQLSEFLLYECTRKSLREAVTIFDSQMILLDMMGKGGKGQGGTLRLLINLSFRQEDNTQEVHWERISHRHGARGLQWDAAQAG